MDIPQLDGRGPKEEVLGSMPDILQYAQFDWYEPVYYWEPVSDFSAQQKLLGWWIGVATVSIDLMACYILTDSGKVVIRISVWALSKDEQRTPDIVVKLAELDKKIQEKLGDAVKDDNVNPKLIADLLEPPDYLFDDEEDVVEPAELDASKQDADNFTPESYDQYLTAQVLLPQGGEAMKATVIGHKRDQNGKPIGVRNSNPLLDTRLYEVEFPDGSTEEITANLIAETLFSQVGNEGRSYLVLKEVVDHRTIGHALSKDDGFTVDSQGCRHLK